MPRSKQNKKSASGAGTIRRKVVHRNGKEYTYWEARYTVGFDPGTGKQMRKSVTAKTQKEAAQRLRQATTELDGGIYQEPCKMALGQWLDIWQKDYLGTVKPKTLEAYRSNIRNHIKPALGAVRLEALTTPQIQAFYNELSEPVKEDIRPLSPKTIKLIHGVLHKALQQAVSIGYLRFNPSDACILPRIIRKELHPLDDSDAGRFMAAIKGHPFERLYLVALFTGMRRGEVLGLAWDNVDFARGMILINQQLQKHQERDGSYGYHLVPTKNSKGRILTLAPYVMELLRRQHVAQLEWHLKAGACWEDSGLVFTNELGGHLKIPTVYHNFKRIVASIGCPALRMHDLRHSYATAAIRAGDDIKTVQGHLGHATAAFTLDVYGHLTDQMKQASAARMENYIRSISGQ